MPSADPFDLARFVAAQRHVYDIALAEVRHGAKRTHWMWFIFPQLTELGRSAMAKRYGIGGAAEAAAYLAHPVLGRRYREVVGVLQALPEADAVAVFGAVDAVKLRSSLTLFARIGDDPLFAAALARWCGTADPATLALLGDDV
jgi:uncharacterized protein (DUF1810 family)